MDKFKQKNKKKKNFIVLGIMLVFAILGITFLAIGFGSEALVWMKTFGITILVIVSPIIAYIVYKEIEIKIKGM